MECPFLSIIIVMLLNLSMSPIYGPGAMHIFNNAYICIYFAPGTYLLLTDSVQECGCISRLCTLDSDLYLIY